MNRPAQSRDTTGRFFSAAEEFAFKCLILIELCQFCLGFLNPLIQMLPLLSNDLLLASGVHNGCLGQVHAESVSLPLVSNNGDCRFHREIISATAPWQLGWQVL